MKLAFKGWLTMEKSNLFLMRRWERRARGKDLWSKSGRSWSWRELLGEAILECAFREWIKFMKLALCKKFFDVWTRSRYITVVGSKTGVKMTIPKPPKRMTPL
jgi:hypothetical protein